ncbi:hypothetical protein [Streptomyces sp. NPDC046979]|uniref:hypothetical protein n=1 Tax=Streptomyces sp. NPDC046979 TaxID=3154604 RepID=UPI0033D8D66B
MLRRYSHDNNIKLREGRPAHRRAGQPLKLLVSPSPRPNRPQKHLPGREASLVRRTAPARTRQMLYPVRWHLYDAERPELKWPVRRRARA